MKRPTIVKKFIENCSEKDGITLLGAHARRRASRGATPPLTFAEIRAHSLILDKKDQRMRAKNEANSLQDTVFGCIQL